MSASTRTRLVEPSLVWEPPREESSFSYLPFRTIGDLALSKYFDDFCNNATTMANVAVKNCAVEEEVNMEASLTSKNEPAFFAALEVLGTLTVPCVDVVIEGVLKWRRDLGTKFTANDATNLINVSTQKLNAADASALIEERQKVFGDWVLLTAALYLLEPSRGMLTRVGRSVSDILIETSYNALRLADRRALAKETPLVTKNRELTFDMHAKLLGLMSQLNFKVVTDRIINDLEGNAPREAPKPCLEYVVKALSYLKLDMNIINAGQRESVSFLHRLVDHFVDTKSQEMKHAFCEALTTLFSPLKNTDISEQQWKNASKQYYDKAYHLATKPKHQLVAFPAAAAVLCIAPSDLFRSNWWDLVDLMLKSMKDHVIRHTVCKTMAMLLDCYLFRHASQEDDATVGGKLNEIIARMFPKPKLSPQDAAKEQQAKRADKSYVPTPLDAYMEVLVTMAHYREKVVLETAIVPLAKDTLFLKRAVIGFGAFAKISQLDRFQNATYQGRMTSVVTEWFPKLSEMFGPFLLHENNPESMENVLQKKAMELELLRRVVSCMPMVVPSDVAAGDNASVIEGFIRRVAPFALSVDAQLRKETVAALLRIVEKRPSYRPFVLNEFASAVSRITDESGLIEEYLDALITALNRTIELNQTHHHKAADTEPAFSQHVVEAAGVFHLCSLDPSVRIKALRVLELTKVVAERIYTRDGAVPALIDVLDAESAHFLPLAYHAKATTRDFVGGMPSDTTLRMLASLKEPEDQARWTRTLVQVCRVLVSSVPATARVAWARLVERYYRIKPRIIRRVIQLGPSSNLDKARQNPLLYVWRNTAVCACGLAGVTDNAIREHAEALAAAGTALPTSPVKKSTSLSKWNIVKDKLVPSASNPSIQDATARGDLVSLFQDLLPYLCSSLEEHCDTALQALAATAPNSLEELYNEMDVYATPDANSTPTTSAAATPAAAPAPAPQSRSDKRKTVAFDQVVTAAVQQTENAKDMEKIGLQLSFLHRSLVEGLPSGLLAESKAHTLRSKFGRWAETQVGVLSDATRGAAPNAQTLRQNLAHSLVAAHKNFLERPSNEVLLLKVQRKSIFEYLMTWSGLTTNGAAQEERYIQGMLENVASPIAKAARREILLQEFSDFRVAVITAMTYLLKGQYFDQGGVKMDGPIFSWINGLFQHARDQVRALASSALLDLLENNLESTDWIKSFVEKTYAKNAAQTSGYFMALADLINRRDFAYEMPVVLNLVMLYRTDRSLAVRKHATTLLRQVCAKHFHKAMPQLTASNLLADASSESVQMDVSRCLANAHPECAPAVLAEISGRLESSESARMHRQMLNYMLPWVQAICALEDPEHSAIIGLLRNLMRLTLKFGEEYPAFIEGLWVAVAAETNVNIIITFLMEVQSARQNPSFLSVAKRITLYLARSSTREVCEPLVKVLAQGGSPTTALEESAQFQKSLSKYRSDASLTSLLQARTDMPKMTDFEFALILLSELTTELSSVLKHFLPVLLNASILELDNASSIVSQHAKILLANLISGLVINASENDSIEHRAGLRVVEQLTVDDGQAWPIEDITLNKTTLDSTTKLTELVHQLIDAFHSEAGLRQAWTTEAYKWGVRSPVPHSACRGLQMLRALGPSLATMKMDALLKRILVLTESANSFETMISNAGSFAVLTECVLTLKEIVQRSDSSALSDQSMLFWVALALLRIDAKPLFNHVYALFTLVVEKTLLLRSDFGVAIAKKQPAEWGVNFNGIWDLSVKALFSSVSEPEAVVFLAKLADTTAADSLYACAKSFPMTLIAILPTLFNSLEGLSPAAPTHSARVLELASGVARGAQALRMEALCRVMNRFTDYTSTQDFFEAAHDPICALLLVNDFECVNFIMTLLEEGPAKYQRGLLCLLQHMVHDQRMDPRGKVISDGAVLVRRLLALQADDAFRRQAEDIMGRIIELSTKGAGVNVVKEATASINSYMGRTWRLDNSTTVMVNQLKKCFAATQELEKGHPGAAVSVEDTDAAFERMVLQSRNNAYDANDDNLSVVSGTGLSQFDSIMMPGGRPGGGMGMRQSMSVADLGRFSTMRGTSSGNMFAAYQDVNSTTIADRAAANPGRGHQRSTSGAHADPAQFATMRPPKSGTAGTTPTSTPGMTRSNTAAPGTLGRRPAPSGSNPTPNAQALLGVLNDISTKIEGGGAGAGAAPTHPASYSVPASVVNSTSTSPSGTAATSPLITPAEPPENKTMRRSQSTVSMPANSAATSLGALPFATPRGKGSASSQKTSSEKILEAVKRWRAAAADLYEDKQADSKMFEIMADARALYAVIHEDCSQDMNEFEQRINHPLSKQFVTSMNLNVGALNDALHVTQPTDREVQVRLAQLIAANASSARGLIETRSKLIAMFEDEIRAYITAKRDIAALIKTEADASDDRLGIRFCIQVANQQYQLLRLFESYSSLQQWGRDFMGWPQNAALDESATVCSSQMQRNRTQVQSLEAYAERLAKSAT